MPALVGRQRGRAAGWVVAAVALVGSGSVGFAEADTPATEATVTVPLAPVRILDTRTGIGAAAKPLGPGESLDLQVVGAGGVPVGAVGVLLNLTADGATATTYLTAWPTGADRPEASVLNAVPGQALPNFIEAKLSADGKLSIYNFAGSVNVLADVSGYQVLVSGVTGLPGGAGSRGLSAWDPIPSGQVVRGAATWTTPERLPSESQSETVALPGLPPVALTNDTIGFGAHPAVIPSDVDPDCAGPAGYVPQAPPPGQLCFYVVDFVAASSVLTLAMEASASIQVMWSGPNPKAPTRLSVRWVYTAP